MIVAIAPDTESRLETHFTGQWVPHYTVIPLNEAAVKYVGDKQTGSVPLYKLVPVTLNNLKKKTPIVDAPLRAEPPIRARVVYRR